MKIIIASAAIQITFGLRRFIFIHFNTIHLSPGMYRIPEINDKLLGHVDKSKKTITLSWHNTEYGFDIPDDAHNVVLHELAHAILFENSLGLSYEEFFSRPHWDNWLIHAEKRWRFNQYRKNVLLAEYADSNLLEMFAVCVETFFEIPEKFKKLLPDLYAAMVDLLGQDPCNGEDPRINK